MLSQGHIPAAAWSSSFLLLAPPIIATIHHHRESLRLEGLAAAAGGGHFGVQPTAAHFKRTAREIVRSALRHASRTRSRPPQAAPSQQQSAPTATSSPRSGALALRTPDVGTLPNLHADVATAATKAGRRLIASWVPPTSSPIATLASMPVRSCVYSPIEAQQLQQLATVRAWALSRFSGTAWGSAVFAIGTMEKAVRKWRATHPTVLGPPPLAVLRVALCTVAAPTACVSSTGHLWTVRDLAPLDARQMAFIFGSPSLAPAFTALVVRGDISEYRMRSLWGQATHATAVREVVYRLCSRLGARAIPSAPKINLLGAGAGITGLQVVDSLRSLGGCCSPSIAAAADACPIASAVGPSLLLAHGHNPHWFARAECPALATSAWSSFIDVVTLRCQPFSLANPNFPLGVEAALNELCAVMAGVMLRRPRMIMYENTSGLWARPSLRRRLETVLLRTTEQIYDWESARLCPHQHWGECSLRDRVFYMAVLRE